MSAEVRARLERATTSPLTSADVRQHSQNWLSAWLSITRLGASRSLDPRQPNDPGDARKAVGAAHGMPVSRPSKKGQHSQEMAPHVNAQSVGSRNGYHTGAIYGALGDDAHTFAEFTRVKWLGHNCVHQPCSTEIT